MNEITDWTLLRSFLAVVRTGSLSAAARLTRATQPTIGRHIDELEAGLRAALFTRSPSGLRPTETGLSLVPHAEAMEAAFAALQRTAAAGRGAEGPVGVVRISASEVMGAFVLPGLLAGLRPTFPGIVIELALNNRTDDLLRRDADIAVRMARPVQSGLVAKKLGAVRLGLHAHRGYIKRWGMPAGVDDLPRHHLVGFDRDDHSARSVIDGVLPVSRTLFSFRCDSDIAQVMAVRAGLGIGLLQHAMRRNDPDLVPVLPEAISFDLECWLVMHEDQKRSPPVRAIFDGLGASLAGWIADGANAGASGGR